jgi:hypothetical protein
MICLRIARRRLRLAILALAVPAASLASAPVFAQWIDYPTAGVPRKADGTVDMEAEAARVREEMRRPDFGHLVVKTTVDDPKAYTKPWTVTLKERIVVNAELIDEICLENEQDYKELKGLQ